MPITVKAYMTLKQALDNQASVDVPCGPVTVQELLGLLAQRFGNGFKAQVFNEGTWTVGPHVRILINGRHYGTLPEKLETRVTEDDEICLFPPIAGG